MDVIQIFPIQILIEACNPCLSLENCSVCAPWFCTTLGKQLMQVSFSVWPIVTAENMRIFHHFAVSNLAHDLEALCLLTTSITVMADFRNCDVTWTCPINIHWFVLLTLNSYTVFYPANTTIHVLGKLMWPVKAFNPRSSLDEKVSPYPF